PVGDCAAIERRAPARPPPNIDDPVMGEGEHPAPKGGIVAPEARQVAHDLEEGLAHEIFRFGDPLAADVAEHGRGQRPVHLGGVAAGLAGASSTGNHDTWPDVADVPVVIDPPGPVAAVVVVVASWGPEPAVVVVVPV